MLIKLMRRRGLSFLFCLSLFNFGCDLPGWSRSLEEKAYFDLVGQFFAQAGPFVTSLQSKGLKDYTISDLKDGSYLKDQELLLNEFVKVVEIGGNAIKKYNSFPSNRISKEMDQKIVPMAEMIGMSSNLYKETQNLRHEGLSLAIKSPGDEKLVKKVIEKENEMLKTGLLISIDRMNGELKKALKRAQGDITTLKSGNEK